MIIAAFDPGLQSGALAIINISTRRAHSIQLFDLPTIGTGGHTMLDGAAIAGYLRASPEVDRVVVEAVGAMPGQGISSTAKFMRATGQIIGVVQALGIPLEFASPAKWKRDMRLPGGKEKGEAARARAIELYPAYHGMLARKKDHNRAEALLIGHWWLQKEGK